jgi:hypothetical protein
VDDKAVPCSLWNRFAFVVGVMLVTDDVDRKRMDAYLEPC